MENIKKIMGLKIASYLESVACLEGISEIRLRADKPLILKSRGKEIPVRDAFRPSADDIRETMERISQHSFYAFEAELSAGYITLPGGHRVGVSGQVVTENGAVKAWRYISGINIRVAHSVPGCADEIMPQLLTAESASPAAGVPHTMIISPPAFGKTTILRDIVRQLSDSGLTVGLADERSEIAGCFRGIPQNDVGIRTDIIDGCPKSHAMLMLLRGMSPDIIAVDELGGEQDARAVEAVLNAGVKLICTAHGRDMADVKQNPSLAALLNRNIFERFIVLKGVGKPHVY
ncbi:MAG: stage III sporulation protein AA [Defluviitaleaceae bacterium]|nr:stage III sporulation protein AA [Defluviitaleaceae bacterium]